MNSKNNKKLPKKDDCGCGKAVKVTERKRYNIKKITKK